MSGWRAELSLQRRTRQLQLTLANDFEPWLALLAARHEQPAAAIIAALDADPAALLSEIATLRYQDAIRHAHHLMGQGKTRKKKIAESYASEHDVERLGAALAETWIGEQKQQGAQHYDDRKARALAQAKERQAARANAKGAEGAPPTPAAARPPAQPAR